LPPVAVVVREPASTAGVLWETVFQVLPELLPVERAELSGVAMVLVREPVVVAFWAVPVDGLLDTTGLKGRKLNGLELAVTPEHLADQLDQM
jgi:hypothetical protein